MTKREGQPRLDGAPAFVTTAVDHLSACLGDEHPVVAEGRRVRASAALILAALRAGS